MSSRSKNTVSSSASMGFQDTAVEMQYEMWVIPIHHFVALQKLLPHQELLKQGKLVRHDQSMKAILFLSHRK